MAGHPSNEMTFFFRIPELGNLELLHAAYASQRFSPHFHKGHVLGAIEKGQLGFDYRGERLVASPGQINLADPGEVHNGFPVSDQGWQYRMFYLAPGQAAAILGQDKADDVPAPFFKKGVVRDRTLARALIGLHRDFQDPAVSFLEKETRFFNLVHAMVRRHAPDPPPLFRTGQEKKRVAEIRTYIQDHFRESVCLDDLARVSRLSKYYLVRVFAAHTGLTPHAYLSQVRAVRAKEMMAKGMPIAEAALNSGFFDQSHLNRVFKRQFGITPGQYSRARNGI